MSETKELTYEDVASHNTKKDLYLVIHDKVYDSSSFVDEHPGGEEVLLDVGGQDATEAFEDVGHSDEAREILHGLLVGNLKRKEGDPKPRDLSSAASSAGGAARAAADQSGMGVALYAVVLVGAALAYGAYNYLSQKQGRK